MFQLELLSVSITEPALGFFSALSANLSFFIYLGGEGFMTQLFHCCYRGQA